MNKLTESLMSALIIVAMIIMLVLLARVVFADSPAWLFIKTQPKAADRFIIDPESGGYGVYDRTEQQSVRIETAEDRYITSIFSE
jgi:hypothetical protein